MRPALRTTLIVSPLVVGPALGWLYTDLNLYKRLFVDRLGCGCEPGFNTNFLTLTVFAALAGGTAASWWLATRGLPRVWALAAVVALVVAGTFAFQRFVLFNWWM